MAIQFQCACCHQPIEIDDVWASKLVACPFCKKTVTAPPMSTLIAEADIPTASSAAKGSSGRRLFDRSLPGESEPSSARNIPAILAAISAVMMVIAMYIYISVSLEHAGEILKAMGDQTDPFKGMESMQKYIDARGGRPPDWLLSMMATIAATGIFWLLTAILGVIGLRTKRRRSWAITALVLASLAPPAICCGGPLISGIQGPPTAGTLTEASLQPYPGNLTSYNTLFINARTDFLLRILEEQRSVVATDTDGIHKSTMTTKIFGPFVEPSAR